MSLSLSISHTNRYTLSQSLSVCSSVFLSLRLIDYVLYLEEDFLHVLLALQYEEVVVRADKKKGIIILDIVRAFSSFSHMPFPLQKLPCIFLVVDDDVVRNKTYLFLACFSKIIPATDTTL